MDFVLKSGSANLLPIEVKFQNLAKSSISRGYRSFLQAYKPAKGVVLNKNQTGTVELEGTKVYFIPMDDFMELFDIIRRQFGGLQ